MVFPYAFTRCFAIILVNQQPTLYSDEARRAAFLSEDFRTLSHSYLPQVVPVTFLITRHYSMSSLMLVTEMVWCGEADCLCLFVDCRKDTLLCIVQRVFQVSKTKREELERVTREKLPSNQNAPSSRRSIHRSRMT